MDSPRLEEHLSGKGVEGYLVYASSEAADQYYLSGFDAPDPFVTLYDGEVRLLFSRSLEYGRAVREADATTVERGAAYDYGEKIEEHGGTAGWHRTIASFLEAYGVESVAVPPRFPLGTADGLREQGVTVRADDEGIVTELRAAKTDAELEHVRVAQRANEAAMARAEQLLADASIEGGRLVHDGEALTSEQVKEEIEMTLLRHGCGLDDTIVACGRDAADPHERGGGPLQAGEPIIVDIFPRHKHNRYHADMTRTFCRGEPDETIREWYELTRKSKQAALEALEPGVTGAAVHAAAAEVYEQAGLPTLESDPETETGFIHSTGHGVGLEVHELPRLAPGGGELEPGHVVTVEPGLYDPEVGGVRLEDLVVVTDDGHENLTDYEQSLVV